MNMNDINWSKITHRLSKRAFSALVKRYWEEVANKINYVISGKTQII